MNRYQAVLFDVDGTLLDSAEFIFRAFEYVLAQRQYPIKTRAEIAAVIGRPLEDCYGALTPGNDLKAMCQEHRSFQRQHLDLPTLFSGTLTTLQELRQMGVLMAAVTTRSRVSSVGTLQRCGIDGFFGTIISAEDVQQVKPHPEPVMKALGVLCVPAAQALMVGDTDADILAGKNAGTRTAGVTYGFHGRRILNYGADYVIDQIAKVVGLVKC